MDRLTWKEANGPSWIVFGTPNEFEAKVVADAVRAEDGTPVRLYTDEEDDVSVRGRKVPAKGVAIFMDMDQELTAVFKDGRPVAAVCWTRREMKYRQGIYIHDGGHHYHRDNLRKTEAWKEGVSVESEAAKAFLGL